MEDGFRIVFGEQGLTFARNPYPTQMHELGGVTINIVQIAMLVVSTRLPDRARPVHHAARGSGSPGARPCRIP